MYYKQIGVWNMFCKKCGKPTEGDRMICDACAAAAQPTEPAETQTVQPEQPIEQESFSLNATRQKPPRKKVKKFPKTALIIILVAVLGLGIGTWFSRDYIASFFNRTFSSPEDYLQSVEQKAQQQGSMVDILGSIYSGVVNSQAAATGAAEVNLRLTAGKELIDGLEGLLEQQYGTAVDLSWFREILLKADANVTEDGMSMNMGVGLNGTQILSMQFIAELGKGLAYMGYPELSDTFLKMDISQLTEMDYSAITEQSQQLQALNAKYADKLPSEAQLENKLYSYFNTALAQLDDVKKDTKTIKVKGISQKLTVLKAKIYEKDALDIAIAVLKKAEKDTELHQMLQTLSDYISEASALMAQGSSVTVSTMDVDALVAAIPDMIESLESVEATEEGYIVLETYVDMTDTIQGRTIRIDDKKISYITVWDGNKFASKIDLTDLGDILIEGDGTKKNGKATGKYDLIVSGETLLTLRTKDLDTDALEDGTLLGTIRLTPGEALMEQLAGAIQGSPIGSVAANLDIALELESGKNSGAVRVLLGNKTLIGLELDVKEKASTAIQPPDKFVSADDQSNLQSWSESLNLNKVLENLKKAGIPDSFFEIFSQPVVY